MVLQKKLSVFYAYLLLVRVLVLTAVTSCSGRCGLWWSLPCSCHETCVVYNNCCEGMSVHCPQLLEESQAKFDTSLRDHCECSEQGVFMISGCATPADTEPYGTEQTSLSPSNFLGTAKGASVINHVTNVLGKSPNLQVVHKMLSSESAPMRSLAEIFMSAPVTDASTGLVYKNLTVFSCYVTNMSDPITWKASVLTDAVDEPKNVQILSDLMDNTKVWYMPPDQMPEYLKCRPDCIDQCQEEMKDENGDLENKCKHGDFNYVSLKVSIGNICFKNMYCGQCNVNTSLGFEFVKQPLVDRKNRLSFVISLSEASLKIAPGSSPSRFFMMWEEVICPLENPSADLGNDVHECHVKSCNSGFVKRPDGICRMPVLTIFAVADDGFPLTADDIQILPQFVQCLMKKAIPDEIVHARPEVTTVHDMSFDSLMHITYVESFTTYRSTFLNWHPNSREFFVKLSAIAKSFQKYRQNKQKFSACGGDNKTTSVGSETDHCHTTKMAKHGKSSLDTIKFRFVYDNHSQIWDRGAVVDNGTKTTMCFCRNLGKTAKEDAKCAPQCVKDPWYIQENDDISEFLNLSCLAKVTPSVKQSNSQAESCQTLNIWSMMFIVGMYLIVK